MGFEIRKGPSEEADLKIGNQFASEVKQNEW